jgi:alkanesulfonate monooxygenase SsuD/methylene tetrahydromethanopterin reductase-like flavin-dependent oxidoreductase (luciferase family)
MPDYTHPLRFGSFISPVNTAPRHPVDLATLSEDLGLDLVTFQDHPYQARFHDTWTLLAWVTAKTSRINVSGNVLNLPLRQPAVLARALASLDLLSGGRVELGIGSGGFFDQMATMGAPLLTPADAATGLDEALDIIRGIWDTSIPSALDVDGQFHRVSGAARGPTPAHDIPIWVGAYKPRMQRIIGRKGDGWLPSLPWLKPGDLASGNRVIDESARKAGRDPREITRLMNVTPEYSAEDLAELAIEHGVSVFIMGSDDPQELRRFAEVTAPEISDRVGAARAGGDSPSTRSRAVPEFGGDPVPAPIAERAFTPIDPGYARYTSGYFRGARPGLVLRPQTSAEVQEAVRFAARHRDLPLGLFSAGHGLSGRSLNNGGLVIALDALNDVTVADANRVRIGPGARWGEVARALAPHGLAITSGDHGGVGVGGLITTAGIGWFARKRGLTIDHLRSADVVTADGQLVHASAEENSDLFWAVRGAGANFGAAVSFEVDAHPVSEKVGFAILTFVPDDITVFLEAWGTAIETAHPSVTGTLTISPTRPGAPLAVLAMIVVDSDDPDTVINRLRPIAALAPLANQSVQMTPYSALLELPVGGEVHQGFGDPRGHSGLVAHLSSGIAHALSELLTSGSPFILSVRSAGGAVADTPVDATAYAWRNTNFLIATLGGHSPDFEQRWEKLIPLFDGMYLSFETDTGKDVVARAFPPAHLQRLQILKRTWDPTGLFRDNFFIDPTVGSE